MVAIALFGCIAGLTATDIAMDIGEGTSLEHVVTEAGLFLLGLAGLVTMALRFAALRRRARELQQEAGELAERLEASAADAARWRAEAHTVLTGLGAEIDRQLTRWELTPAEKEVALLLLKGLSHKEVAEARGTTEATARQQARAVYRKAGLTGRHDLAAFFLEDLLLPPSS